MPQKAPPRPVIFPSVNRDCLNYKHALFGRADSSSQPKAVRAYRWNVRFFKNGR